MILGIVLFILFIRFISKMYDKACKHNLKIVGNYLYEVIKAANRG